MLGEKIRSKRIERGYSLKELSEKVELTASFLSQVERDLAEPSITSLRKISEALEVPIFSFLIDDDVIKPVVRLNERKKLNMPDSGLSYELLTTDLNRMMELFVAKIPAAFPASEQFSTHAGEECNLILAGKMRIIVGEDEYDLEEGDSIYYFASIPHKVINIGDTELAFLSAITPPRF